MRQSKGLPTFLAAAAALLSLGACAALKVPTEQSIQGLTPVRHGLLN